MRTQACRRSQSGSWCQDLFKSRLQVCNFMDIIVSCFFLLAIKDCLSVISDAHWMLMCSPIVVGYTPVGCAAHMSHASGYGWCHAVNIKSPLANGHPKLAGCIHCLMQIRQMTNLSVCGCLSSSWWMSLGLWSVIVQISSLHGEISMFGSWYW